MITDLADGVGRSHAGIERLSLLEVVQPLAEQFRGHLVVGVGEDHGRIVGEVFGTASHHKNCTPCERLVDGETVEMKTQGEAIGCRQMASIAYVEVTGGGNAEAVGRRIAALGLLTEPPVAKEGEWVAPMGQSAVVNLLDDDPMENGGYPVSIQVYSYLGETETETAAAELYDRLRRATPWGLRRLDVEASTVASRPAVSRAS